MHTYLVTILEDILNFLLLIDTLLLFKSNVWRKIDIRNVVAGKWGRGCRMNCCGQVLAASATSICLPFEITRAQNFSFFWNVSRFTLWRSSTNSVQFYFSLFIVYFLICTHVSSHFQKLYKLARLNAIVVCLISIRSYWKFSSSFVACRFQTIRNCHVGLSLFSQCFWINTVSHESKTYPECNAILKKRRQRDKRVPTQVYRRKEWTRTCLSTDSIEST